MKLEIPSSKKAATSMDLSLRLLGYRRRRRVPGPMHARLDVMRFRGPIYGRQLLQRGNAILKPLKIQDFLSQKWPVRLQLSILGAVIGC